MLLEKLYTAVHKSGTYNASAYCITRSNRVIEITLFNKVVVNIRALAMTEEEVLQLFQTGDFKDINIVSKETRGESIDDKIIEKFLPLAANYLFDPDYVSIFFVARMLDIMEYISRNKNGSEAGPAFSLMAKTLAERCPGFTMVKDTLLQRFDDFEKVTGSALLSLNKQPVPSNSHQLLSWALNRTASNDALMAAFIRYFLFWGELCTGFSRVAIREDKSPDHKPGTAGISLQKEFSQYQGVRLYRGLIKTGQLQLVEEKKGSYMSPEARLASSVQDKDTDKERVELIVNTGDLQSMGLRNGENIVCLFE